MLDKIKSHSPYEVYALYALYVAVLFLNSRALFGGSRGLFDTNGSIVYDLLKHFNVSHFNQPIAYWTLLLTTLFLVAIKGKRISKWLWRT